MKNCFTRSLPIILTVLSTAFGSYSQAPVLDKPNSPRQVLDNYRIGPGDVIDIMVSQNETLSRSGVRVNQKGGIQIAMHDHDITAACLTERELADLIRDKYRKYLVNPYVNVSVREFNSSPVALIGAVNSPGRFQLQRPVRLLELLTYANGPQAAAGQTVEILRSSTIARCHQGKLVLPDAESDELISLNLEDVLKGSETSNMPILAGDIIRVPTAEQKNAYVQGNVRASAVINLKDPVTLSQAVAMAGGLVGGANSDRIKIRRQVPNSPNRKEMVVDLKAINLGTAPDILLEPNDIVDVPGPSSGRKILQTLMNAVIPQVTQLPTTIVRY